MIGELYRDGPLNVEPEVDSGWAEAQIRPGCLKTTVFMLKHFWRGK
jgi:hypothetical protein